MKPSFVFALLAGLLVSVVSVQAEDPAAAAMARLRDTLRTTTLQLRTAQAELATAQASSESLALEKKALGVELELLKKQLVTDRLASDQAINALKAAASTQNETLTVIRAELDKTRASLTKVVDYAKKTEMERNELTARVSILERQAEDQISRNVTLYKLGNEILDRYAQFGLGQAIIAREPFIGTSRVKLETQVQDYGDRLRDQRINKAPALTATSETNSPVGQ